MSWELLLALGLLTYGSRVLALAVMPQMPAHIAKVLDRMPSALFAGLAVISLVGPGPVVAEPRILAAAAGAMLATPLRSLPLCLAAGIGAFLVVSLFI